VRRVAARLGIVALGYLVVILLIASQEGQQVYAAEWSRRGVDTTLAPRWRRVAIPTPDGITLDAVVASPLDAPKATILYLHGNAASIWSDQVREKLRAYQGLGYRVLAIDYRGYGFNAGAPSEAGLYADALAAAQYAEDSLGTLGSALVIHGMSLGSGVAAEVAVRRPPRLLILDGAFTSLPDVAADHYPWIPARLLMRNRFPTLARLDSLRSPVLIVHATNDEVIPFKFGEALATHTRTPTWFLTTKRGHVAGAFGDVERFGWTLEGILTPPEQREWGWWGPE
jgi:uncharacterized protein